MRFETRLIHAGEIKPRIGGEAVVPIFQSTVFEQREGGGYDDILYPRLSTLPNHRVLAARLASLEGGEDALVAASGMAAISFAGFGGMLSFELESGEAASAWIKRLRIPIHGPSFGGPETLVTRPALTSHAGIAPEERIRLGIPDGLVRMSVGLEDPDDVIEDLEQAFGAR